MTIHIYLVTNTANGKKYVGQTRQTIRQRWNSHKRAALKGSLLALSYAIRKYGPESFVLEQIAVAETEAEAHELEKQWIKDLSTTDRMFGYNLTFGGQGAAQTEEIIQKIGAASRALWADPEFRARSLASRDPKAVSGTKNGMYGVRGADHPFFGRKHSEETKAKISAIRKEKFKDPEFKARMSAANTGKHHTEKGRANIAKALIGNQYGIKKRTGEAHNKECT